jgi:hypothetical protein
LWLGRPVQRDKQSFHFLTSMTQEIPNLPDQQSDRCQRWRKIAIDQLSYTLNLTLTFTIAALGFWFALLKDKDFTPVSAAKPWMWSSLAGLTLSAFFGFICDLCRLWDFRGTARRACQYGEAPSKDELRELGETTWVLLYVQLGTFLLGVIALAGALLLSYGGKLC